MAHTPDMAAMQAAAMTKALEEVTPSLHNYAEIIVKNAASKDITDIGAVSEAQTDLVAKLRTLNRIAQGPVTMLFSHFENMAYTGTVRTLLDMGVFTALPGSGEPVSIKELAQRVDAEEDLLLRMMRITTPELFAEPKPNEFAHTPFSLIYLAPPLRACFEFMNDEYGTTWLQMHDYFKQHGYKTPQSETDNPYTFVNRTEGLNMWQYIAKEPWRRARFNFALQSQSQGASWAVPLYPFKAEFEKLPPTDDNTVLLVDIGGGRGQATTQIKALLGGDIKGKLILEDLPEVIQTLQDEPLEGIEALEYDFFTPQPIKGAHMYYLRRCLHDWSDAQSIKILSNIAAAMDPKSSRLLIAEIIVPPSHVDSETAWMDLIFMTFTGKQRTRDQWVDLLDKSGLRLETVYTTRGTNYGVIEAWLK